MFGRKYKLRSRKYIREKRRRLVFESVVRFGIIVLFFVLLALTAHLKQFKIEQINILGNDVIHESDLYKIASEEIEGKYFKIFPKNNSIIFPRRGIGSEISSKYKRIEETNISFGGLHVIKIQVREREPKGVWCGETIELSNVDELECYFVDGSGYIFSIAPKFSGNLFFKYYGGEIGEDIIGKYYLSEEKFKEISFLLQSFKNIKLNPVSYEWGGEGDSKVVVEANSDSNINSLILFNNKDDLGFIFENLKLVLEDDVFSGDEVLSLEYIDLRFGNKIYFK